MMFKADDKLITLLISSLKLEYNIDNDYLPIGVVSPSIYFVYKGKMEVTLKD